MKLVNVAKSALLQRNKNSSKHTQKKRNSRHQLQLLRNKLFSGYFWFKFQPFYCHTQCPSMRENFFQKKINNKKNSKSKCSWINVKPSVTPARCFGKIVLGRWSFLIPGSQVLVLFSSLLNFHIRCDSLHCSLVKCDWRLFIWSQGVENFRVCIHCTFRYPWCSRTSIETQRHWESLQGQILTINFAHFEIWID